MTLSLQNIFTLIAAGLLLLAGVFILRFMLKFAWRVVRVALILLSLVILAGYLLGFLEIGLL
jgi:energy-coupling factor transporter transmembrane protein EcfT